jgi:hypothetical protein
MGIKFTKIVLSTVALFMMMAQKSNAATITATVSGNWSSSTTWSGGAAGATISGIDNVVIPAGISVTMDMDVQVTSLLSSISVSGNLNSSSTHSLMITQGTISGNGNINLYYLEIGTIGGMSFTGNLTVNRFITSSTTLNLGSQVTLMDTLCLKAGNLTLGSGSILTLNTNSNIKVEDGTISLGAGVFAGTNSYNVMYVGSSKTTGIELGGSGFNHFYVQLSGANQNLTLGSNTMVNGILHHDMGTLSLGGKKLTIVGDYLKSNGSTISGSTTSDLWVQTAGVPSSDFMFTSGAQTLRDLNINIFSADHISIKSNLAISGTISLEKGSLWLDNTAILTMNSGSNIHITRGDIVIISGNFNGTAVYNVSYSGNGKLSGTELTGAGLNDVALDMNFSHDSVKIAANTTINGTLMLNKGSLNLNGYSLELKGNLSSSISGWFQGDVNSDLTINTAAALGDTIKFSPALNMLNNLTINTGNGTNVMLDNNLMVENLMLTNGGVTIYDDTLTINATGSITGYGVNKYVMIKGEGQLMMNVVTLSPYSIFPVGTANGYGAAYIRRTAGTTAMLGVGTHDGIWAMGTSGSNMATSLSVVDRTWNISSPTTSTVSMDVKFEWATAMEVNGFDRTMAYVSKYSNNWDMMAPSTSTTVGTGMYQLTRSGVTSPGQFAVVDNVSALSVKEQEGIAFSLYPNPAHNHLTVNVKDNDGFSVEVFDALGNKSIAAKIIKDSSVDIDFSSLSAGVYFVKISNNTTQSVKRVVKQ